MDENGNFSKEEIDLVKEHVARTQRQATVPAVSAPPVQTVVVNQKNEPVLTPVEGVAGDPESFGEDVNDHSEVRNLERKRGRKVQAAHVQDPSDVETPEPSEPEAPVGE